MKIIYKKVGEAPRPLIIDGELKTMQNIVDGYIQVVPITTEVMMVCNEEGKLAGLPFNFSLPFDDIVGDVFFCGSDGENLTDCPETALGIKMILEELRDEK